MSKAAVALTKRVDSRILFLRGQKIILDSDLAELYGVPSKRLNQQVTRNVHRFPADFRFRLSRSEFENLRLQFATSSGAWRQALSALRLHRARCHHGCDCTPIKARDSDEHFRSPRLRANARGHWQQINRSRRS